MTKTHIFVAKVCQQIEFAGFGPCAAVGSAVVVQAFSAIKRFDVTPALEVKAPGQTYWDFPSLLTPTTLGVCKIIQDAWVSKGMQAPGAQATLRLTSDDLPFSLELRYLWLADPEAMQRTVVALLLYNDLPIWATESQLHYHSKRDAHAAERLRVLIDTYTAQHPAPIMEFLEILPEIRETVDHMN